MAEWHVMLNDRILDRFWVEEGDKINIGRGKDADVCLDNTAVSRHHARLELLDGTLTLTDLKSKNGTLVNRRKVRGAVTIRPSDRIQIGKFQLVRGGEPDGGFPPFAMLREPGLSPSGITPSDFDETVIIAPNRLTVIEGKVTPERFSLRGKDTVTLGKDSTCDVRVNGWRIGKTQCYIIANKMDYYLVHHSGSDRTTLNGRKIRGKQKLRRGDIIGIGKSKLRFQ
jgi:pSer/pThr/pTyr-binding forkhead associated (FHA) protein